MSISVECSSCGHEMQVKDEMLGRSVKCKECGTANKVGKSKKSKGKSRQAKQNPVVLLSLLGVLFVLGGILGIYMIVVWATQYPSPEEQQKRRIAEAEKQKRARPTLPRQLPAGPSNPIGQPAAKPQSSGVKFVLPVARVDATFATASKHRDKMLSVEGIVAYVQQKRDGVVVRLEGNVTGIELLMMKDQVPAEARLGSGQRVVLLGEMIGPQYQDQLMWRVYRADSAPPILTADQLAELCAADFDKARLDLQSLSVFITGKCKEVNKTEYTTEVTFETKNGFPIHSLVSLDGGASVEAAGIKPGSDLRTGGSCFFSEDGGKKIRQLGNAIAVQLPQPSIAYAKEIEPRDARLGRIAAAMRAAQTKIASTPEALAAEFKKDREAAERQLDGQIVEVTGKVKEFRELDSQVKPKSQDAIMLDLGKEGMECELSESNPANQVLPGQSVVLRGRLVHDLGGPVLRDAVIAKLAPDSMPAVEKSVDDLAEQLLKDPKAFGEKHQNTWIVLAGPLQAVDKAAATFKAKNEVLITGSLGGYSPSRNRTQFAGHKPGDAVKLVGQITQFNPDTKMITLGSCWERR